MALIRMTEKKLAASRANARLSKGPTSATGKEKVSRNACKHHLYARKFPIPPAWEARIRDVVDLCAATVADPVERACLIEYFVFELWIIELFAYETRLFNQSIARHRNFNRGVHDFAVHNPLFLAIESRSHFLNRKADQARRAWIRAKRAASTRQAILHLVENTIVTTEPKARTMAAGVGGSPSITPSALIEASRPAPITPPTRGLPLGRFAPAVWEPTIQVIHPFNNLPPP